jgi:hypothetical protein
MSAIIVPTGRLRDATMTWVVGWVALALILEETSRYSRRLAPADTIKAKTNTEISLLLIL